MRFRGICLLLISCWLVQLADVEARPRRRKARKVKVKKQKVASKKTTVAIVQLLKPYKWGMSSGKVRRMLEKGIRKSYAKRLKEASKEPLQYDRVRKEMMGSLAKLKKSIIQFAGKRSSWDVSMIDKEFAHKNFESMLVRWGDRDRRFFLFHHDKLYKVFIAFNATAFRGKSFADFAGVMETRFGPAERKYAVTIKGDAKMAYLVWPPSRTTILRAMDNTAIYGNFCLMLLDRKEWPRVTEGRKLNSPNKKYSDPLIEAVTAVDPNEATRRNPDEDIVDQITGRGTNVPVGSDTASSSPRRSSGTTGTSTPPRRKKKKLNSKNPLDGIDL